MAHTSGRQTFGAWDRSGFTSWVFAQHGIKLTAFTYAMKNELRPTSNPQPGDIVFQNGYSHVGYLPGRRQDDLRSEPHQRYHGAPHLLDVR